MLNAGTLTIIRRVDSVLGNEVGINTKLNSVTVSSPLVQLGIPDRMSPEMDFLDINMTQDSSLLLHANSQSFYWADF
jgi:hypothetical protein